jgi:hypothetical protein
MNARSIFGAAALLCIAAAAPAHAMGVEVWTARGNEAVYQPGDRLEVEARASDDAYLLVYEIDADGRVNLLFPYRGSDGFVEGRRTYQVPPERANLDLVVQEPTGQCYVVAIASRQPFNELPWYLHPYDAAASEVGYVGERDDEEGVTAEGRIVGDPFVAMERIRRRVVDDPEDADAFATSYTSYYVHDQVRYPRYLCYDCHRPGHYAWWSGFDPYYTTCSVFDFRINSRWYWGPGYWFGATPYYYYVYRYDCAPRFHRYRTHFWYSSWDGWRRWCNQWGGPLVRYKSSPPPGYVPPTRYRDGRVNPPGFLASGVVKGRGSLRTGPPSGHFAPARSEGGAADRNRGREAWRSGGAARPGAEPAPSGTSRDQGWRNDGDRGGRREGTVRPMPRRETAPEATPRRDGGTFRRGNEPMPRRETPARELGSQGIPRERVRSEMPVRERPRDESPRSQYSPAPRQRPAEAPRAEAPKVERSDHGGRHEAPRPQASAPRSEPRGDRGVSRGGGQGRR